MIMLTEDPMEKELQREKGIMEYRFMYCMYLNKFLGPSFNFLKLGWFI